MREFAIPHTQTNTPTRVWLEDFAAKHPDPSSLDLHGFDISPAQFPTGHENIIPGKTRILLSVHDTLVPYPAEHLGRYDLVHIRLLTAGLKQGDYTVVLKNARSLLSATPPTYKNATLQHSIYPETPFTNSPIEPNGYIQWEEIDTTSFCTNKLPELPAITTMRNTVSDAMLKLGLWPFAPQTVYDEICAGGFHNIHRETYTTEGKEAVYGTATKWVAGVMRALVPTSMVALGQAEDQEEARRKVGVLVGEFEEHCTDALALVSLGVTVGQRCD